jgi:hemoglobin
MRHMPFRVGVVERDQWLACMAQAMAEVGVPEALQTKLKASFFQTADWMRNQAEA